MRWQRFLNWCRESVGLPRKPIHYFMRADGGWLGASPKPEWSRWYFSWLWRAIKGGFDPAASSNGVELNRKS